MSEKSYSLKLKNFLSDLNEDLKPITSLGALNEIGLKYVDGKKSFLNKLSKEVRNLSGSDKKGFGVDFNLTKDLAGKMLEDKRRELLAHDDESSEWVDLTLPTGLPKVGRLSPDTIVIREMNAFFTYHGFSVVDDRDIESDDFNFERTNLPKDHPARDLQDTIYIKRPEILLRTHTSSVETRILSSHKPPVRFVVPGFSYRNELLNPSNHAMFQQYQGVLIDKGIGMGNLKAFLEEFAKYLYGNDIQTRFRTKYYPEVEPGAGMDIQCRFCGGTGQQGGKACMICKQRGWIEILGCGMVHRNLLEKCGIDWKVWSGFAFGMGLDRIIMTKFHLEDIRDLHGGTLVYEDAI